MEPLITLNDRELVGYNRFESMKILDDENRKDKSFSRYIDENYKNYDITKSYPGCENYPNPTRSEILKMDYRSLFNINQLEYMSCYIMNKYRIEIIDKIKSNKDWLYGMRSISRDSPVYTGEEELKNYFVIKITDQLKIRGNLKPSDEVTHEGLVGILGTNKMRALIPNFSYIYGNFTIPKCPVQKDVFSNDTCSVTIYERIIGKVFKDFIKSCNFTEFINCILQVALSLLVASRNIDFTHYDLHTQNLIIKPLMEMINITYESYDLRTPFVATFIDYGSSYIKIGSDSYGRGGMEYYGILPRESFWIMDVGKLIFSTFTSTNPTYLKYMYKISYDNAMNDFRKLLNDLKSTYDSTVDDIYTDYVTNEITYEDYENYMRESKLDYEDEVDNVHKKIRTYQDDVRNKINAIEADEISRNEFHQKLKFLLHFFIEEEDPVSFMINYKLKYQFLEIFKTPNNKDVTIYDFVDFVVENFEETQSFLFYNQK